MKQKIIYLVIIVISIPKLGFCQALTSADTVEIKRTATVAQQQFTGKNFAPFGSSALSNFISNVSLSSVLNEGQNGKVELKYNAKNWATIGLSVDQKISKKDKEATPFDLLDGISPGTTIQVNFQKMFWEPLLTSANFNVFDNAATEYSNRTMQPRGGVTFNDVMDNGIKSERDQLKGIKFKSPFFLNFKVSITKSSYSFTTDSTKLTKQNKTYMLPSLGLSLGIIFSVKSFLSISYAYTEKFETGDEINFYSPFGTSSNTYSQTLIFGQPVKKQDSRLNAEWRINFFGTGNRAALGIGPSIAYGIKSEKIAFSLPLYFINGKDAKGNPTGLQGGVRFGYATSTQKNKGSSFKDSFAAQLIVTAPFSIFENL